MSIIKQSPIDPSVKKERPSDVSLSPKQTETSVTIITTTSPYSSTETISNNPIKVNF